MSRSVIVQRVAAAWDALRGRGPLPPKAHVVYAAAAADKIKVGWTGDLRARLGTLQTANPGAVLVWWWCCDSLPHARAAEEAIHAVFDPARVSGEWFCRNRLPRDWRKLGAKAVSDAKRR